MSSEITEGNRVQTQGEIEKLEQEVAVLDARLAKLELENSRSSALLRMLGKAFGFGAAGKLEWARFKLEFKQEELNRLKTQRDARAGTVPHSDSATDYQPARSLAGASETARQKMERMIAENPAVLASHIRRAYKPLIEAEKLANR